MKIIPLSFGLIFGLTLGVFLDDEDDVDDDDFFLLFLMSWHHWKSCRNLRFLLGTMVSVNSVSCFFTGKSGLRFFLTSTVVVVVVGVAGVAATVVAADAKAAA